MMLPTLDMTGWSILDFELAYDGLRHISDAGSLLLNQPRAGAEFERAPPGAAFIERATVDWCHAQIEALTDRLKEIRFDDQKLDERRVTLLINYVTSHGSASEPVARIVQMALDQSVRQPA